MLEVKIGDTIKCRDGKAVVVDIIQDNSWIIEWQDGVYKDLGTDEVIPMLQHNWKICTY